jgi:hypothetical protein
VDEKKIPLYQDRVYRDLFPHADELNLLLAILVPTNRPPIAREISSRAPEPAPPLVSTTPVIRSRDYAIAHQVYNPSSAGGRSTSEGYPIPGITSARRIGSHDLSRNTPIVHRQSSCRTEVELGDSDSIDPVNEGLRRRLMEDTDGFLR